MARVTSHRQGGGGGPRRMGTGTLSLPLPGTETDPVSRRRQPSDVPGSRIMVGDALRALGRLPDESVQCCVTSPPYWGLRDYSVDDQIGAEPILADYIGNLCRVFEEVRRVLCAD